VDVVRRLGIEVRAGVHTGEIVSSAVKDIVVGSGISFSERGDHVLAGVPETWRLFAAAA